MTSVNVGLTQLKVIRLLRSKKKEDHILASDDAVTAAANADLFQQTLDQIPMFCHLPL